MDYIKYLKYKTKYINLKKNIDNKYNFYFVHMTKNFKNFKNIIKDGKIKIGSDIPIGDKYFSGYVDEPYIFANIYFNDLDNLEWFNDLSFIIKPEIIDSQSVELIGGWGNLFIDKIEPNDSKLVKIKKINKIKKFIVKPYGLPNIVLENPKFMQHEVRFNAPIDIYKYLEGISINYTDQDELKIKIKRIKKILKKYNLENIKIFSYDKKILYN